MKVRRGEDRKKARLAEGHAAKFTGSGRKGGQSANKTSMRIYVINICICCKCGSRDADPLMTKTFFSCSFIEKLGKEYT